jgi:general stress protein YciG
MANIRKPTVKEVEKLDKSRELMVRGIEGEKDFLSKVSTTMAKSARDDQKAAKKMRESVPERARDYEAYQEAGYKKGGKVSSASKRADGCAIRGKTKA